MFRYDNSLLNRRVSFLTSKGSSFFHCLSWKSANKFTLTFRWRNYAICLKSGVWVCELCNWEIGTIIPDLIPNTLRPQRTGSSHREPFRPLIGPQKGGRCAMRAFGQRWLVNAPATRNCCLAIRYPSLSNARSSRWRCLLQWKYLHRWVDISTRLPLFPLEHWPSE